MTPGKIVITDKVYFKPDGIEKPNKDDYYGYIFYDPQHPKINYGHGRFYKKEYENDLKEYEASKRLIEVENWVTIDIPNKNCSILLPGKKQGQHEYVWDNQKCKAEVNDDKAEIVELN